MIQVIVCTSFFLGVGAWGWLIQAMGGLTTRWLRRPPYHPFVAATEHLDRCSTTTFGCRYPEELIRRYELGKNKIISNQLGRERRQRTVALLSLVLLSVLTAYGFLQDVLTDPAWIVALWLVVMGPHLIAGICLAVCRSTTRAEIDSLAAFRDELQIAYTNTLLTQSVTVQVAIEM